MQKKRKSKIIAGLMAAIMLTNVLYTTVPTYAGKSDSGTEQETVVETEEVRVLDCPLEVHTHDATCYDADHELICGEADFVVHTHDANCYDSDGTLVCTLPEKKVHTHDSSCYQESTALVCGQNDASEHTHTAACYQTNKVLTCQEEETAGHTHSEECYERVLTCKVPESAGHTHSESCYEVTEEKQLTCGQDEEDGHHHGDSCYAVTEDRDLTCGQAERDGHHHDDSCYTVTTDRDLTCGQEASDEEDGHHHDDSCYTVTEHRELTCGQAEEDGHHHGDDCYTVTEHRDLICGQEERDGHHHDDSCYTVTEHRDLVCGQEETEGHTHSKACYQDQLICGQEESAGHTHTKSCYTEEKTLICSPHTHTDACRETTRTVTCSKEEIELHKHQSSCYDKDKKLTCDKLEVLEHQHTDDCFKTVSVQKNIEPAAIATETEQETGAETKSIESAEIETGAETESTESVETETEAAIAAETENIESAETEVGTEAAPAAEIETEAGTELTESAETENTLGAETELVTEIETEAVSETEALASAETELATEAETVLETETELTTEIETESTEIAETEALSEMPNVEAVETESETAFETETETETETESETETETETEALPATLDPEIRQSLSQAIVEAGETDMELWTLIVTAMYSQDEEVIAQLAEQFEVEPEIMQLYLQELGDTFSILYDALGEDEDDTLWDALMEAQEDEDQLAELAGQLGVDADMLLLFIQYSMTEYESDDVAELVDANADPYGTPEYNLTVKGLSYLAFSLDKTKTTTDGVKYTQKTSVSSGTWNDWLLSTLTTPYKTSKYLIYAVSYCATYYTDDTWITKTTNKFNCTEAEAKPILRAAIQQAIWYLTNTASYSTGDSTLNTFAEEIRSTAWSAAWDMPSPFYYNWYVPSNTSNSPCLLVAANNGVMVPASELYVGFQGEKIYANDHSNTSVINNAQDALYIMPYDDYVNAQSDEERKANAKIAYCFDHYLHWPASTANGYWRVDYTTTYLENRYSLYADTSDDASFKKDKDQIMAIALNGYPHNVSGIYTGQINEDAFRLVTQWAIWNYTDGDAVRSYFTAEEQKIFNYLTTTDLTTTLNNLQKLVDSSDAATAQSYINVYTSMGQAYDSATGQLVTSNDSAYKSDYGFQNLLVVGYRTNAINLPDGNLTVSKTVIGDTSNVSDTEFSFEAVFKSSGKAYTSGIAATFTSAKTSEKRTLTPGNDGKVTFKLKAGESVTMTLPAGVTYTVTEVDLPDNFTVFSPTGGSETGTIESSATKTVAFTNAYSGTLTVSKKVIGDTTGISVSDYGFKTITYFEQDGAAYTGPVLWTKDGTSTIFTSSAAGLAFTIKAGESYTMTVPAGVTYSSSESNIPTGFTMVEPNSGSFSGTIKAGTNAQAAFENRYGDEEETDGTLTVSKTVTGDTDNMPDTSFTFDAVFTNDNAAYTSDISATVTRTTGTTTETWTPDESGKKSFTLKNGESVTMTLPTGVTYTVTETNIPTDFTVTSPAGGSVTDTMTSGAAETADFKNAFTNTVNISGTKTWVNDDTTTRPSSITLGLYKHLEGTPESEDKLVSWDNFTNPFTFTPVNGSWTYKFSNKPKYENGKLITYYVVEENVPTGYTFSYTASNGEANPAKSMNITNTYLKTVSLTLTKSVNEADELKNVEADRKFEFSIELKDKDGKPLTGSYPVTIADGVPTENLVAQTADGVQSYSMNLTDGTTKLYLRAEDSITINGLPEGYSYTITESGVSSGSIDAYLTMIMVDYGSLNESTTRTISGSNVTKDTTNVKYLNQRYSLTLSKKVSGDYADVDLDQAFIFKITLKDSNGNLITDQSYPVLPTTVSGVTNVAAPDIASVYFDANGEATISLKHGQSVILYNLPSGYKYTIQETGLDAQKYQTGYDVKNGKLYDNYTNTSSVSGEQVYYSEEVNCINKRIRQLYNIGLSKTVEGQFGDLNKVFTFKISLTAWDSTPVTGQLSVTASDEVAAQSGITDGKLAFTNGIASVSLKHGQSIVINGLQEGCQYQIQEELGSDSGYTTGIVVQPGDSSIAPITISGTGTVTDTGLRTVAQNETVQYTNTMHDITPTGISTNVAQHAMFLMLMALLAGFVLTFRATRRRQH